MKLDMREHKMDRTDFAACSYNWSGWSFFNVVVTCIRLCRRRNLVLQHCCIWG